VRRTAWVGVLVALHAAPLAAQRDPARLDITLPAATALGSQAPTIRTANVLADRNLRDLLHSGFPARLHYRVELWQAGGIFDNLRTQAEWDVILRYNPLERRYAATRIEGDKVTSLGSYDQLDGAVRALGAPFQPVLSPPSRDGRYYYIALLDVEMLSVNDLSEVERWLRGELSPAVHGERNPGTALSRGAQTLVTRLLGGRSMHYEARTGIFRY
jgi:hypothetical protein